MILKTDCRHFPGDRPCSYNKSLGLTCDDCDKYSPVSFKILIIKLDAIGDVLRTTSILHALKAKYPQSWITWITKRNAAPLFLNNKFVDEVIHFESPELPSRLSVEQFDLLIHPDASPVSGALAAAANAAVKKGFLLNQLGKVIPCGPEAVEWLEMGAFDQHKKRNTKTYQQIIHEIAGLDYTRGEIIINLSTEEKAFRDDFKNKHGLGRYKNIVGINTGSSKRWQLKQWRFEGFVELIPRLLKNKGTAVLLYGGPEEVEKNEYLKEKFPEVICTGTNNTLRGFFALLDLSDIVITGDTLALHASAALNKKTVAVFGPTSYNEIEDYGRITKIHPDMECLVCYKSECDFNPTCMDLISVNDIYEAVIRQIK